MKSSPETDRPMRVGQILRKRLREVDRSPAELAEALRVPTEYIEDLIAGRRRPPLPARTDLYKPMTSFLKVGRDDLATSAASERALTQPTTAPAPTPKVRRLLLDLCEPGTAKALERRRGKSATQELLGFFQRLLDLTQVAVQRVLADQMTLRMVAKRSGKSYADIRLEVLDFLDATPGTLTVEDVTRYLVPRVSRWDVDLETGVLRVVLRPQDTRARDRQHRFDPISPTPSA